MANLGENGKRIRRIQKQKKNSIKDIIGFGWVVVFFFFQVAEQWTGRGFPVYPKKAFNNFRWSV